MRQILLRLTALLFSIAGCSATVEATASGGYVVHAGWLLWGLFGVLALASWVRQ